LVSVVVFVGNSDGSFGASAYSNLIFSSIHMSKGREGYWGMIAYSIFISTLSCSKASSQKKTRNKNLTRAGGKVGV
jgi:hypothetical protein